METIQVTPTAAPDPAKVVNATVDVVDPGTNRSPITRVEVSPEPKPAEEKKQDGDRPAWLPEKFKSPEDLAKAYSELEKKQGKQPDEKKPADEKPVTEEKPGEKKPGDAQEQAAETALSKAGIKLVEFQQEFDEKGELSTESYDRLEKAGFDRGTVDAYIEGRKAVAAQAMSTLFAEAGGTAESYAEMAQWAARSLDKEQIDAFNALVNTGDLNTQRTAIRDLYSSFTASEGREPKLVDGGTSSRGNEELPFQSTYEVTEAMKDPRYKAGDKAFHAYVERRLRRSKVM